MFNQKPATVCQPALKKK